MVWIIAMRYPFTHSLTHPHIHSLKHNLDIPRDQHTLLHPFTTFSSSHLTHSHSFPTIDGGHNNGGGDHNLGSNIDDRNYDPVGGGKKGSGVNDEDNDGGDPMTVLSETKQRSGSVGSGSESMASGTGTVGTEPGDSVGSRLIRNLSLIQGLDAQGQGLAAGNMSLGGGLEREYGGDEMNRHHGNASSSSSSSSRTGGGGGGGGGSSGLHTPPRLPSSMSIGSLESNNNLLHLNQGGVGGSSSNGGVISVSSPIGLLAVLCEQRRDEEMSRSTHTTSSSPRGNILGTNYPKHLSC